MAVSGELDMLTAPALAGVLRVLVDGGQQRIVISVSVDVPFEGSGELKASQTSHDHTRPYWDQIGATIVARHVFDMTDGWDGKPPGKSTTSSQRSRAEPEALDPKALEH